MPIIKLHDEKFNKDYYMEWSTVVDAPVTYGMSLEEFKEYYREEYGNNGMKRLPHMMERVEQTGASDYRYNNVDEFISYNRAGPKEGALSKEGLLRDYCRPETIKK